MQGQLVRGSLLNVVRHVINSLNILSVKLCFFLSVLSELLYTWVKERMNTYFSVCLVPSAFPTPTSFPLYSHCLFLHSLVVTGVCRGEMCSVGSMREQAANINSLHSCLFFP